MNDLAPGGFDPVAELAGWIESDPNQALIEIDRHLVEAGGLRAFVRLSWPSVQGNASSFVDGFHIGAITEHLESVSRGEIRRLIIMIPPRHMKSLSVAVSYPAWDWIKNPWRQFLFSSYAHALSIRDSRRTRRIIQSPWYQQRWGDRYKLVGDQNTKVRFDNDHSGYRLATSVDGMLTGEGGDIIVCLPHDVGVLTSDGWLPIGRIVDERLPVLVAGYDGEETSWQEIVAYERNPGRPILAIHTANHSLRCTEDHPVFVEGRGYVRAADIKAGDVVVTWQSDPALPTVRQAGGALQTRHPAAQNRAILQSKLQQEVGIERDQEPQILWRSCPAPVRELRQDVQGESIQTARTKEPGASTVLLTEMLADKRPTASPKANQTESLRNVRQGLLAYTFENRPRQDVFQCLPASFPEPVCARRKSGWLRGWWEHQTLSCRMDEDLQSGDQTTRWASMPALSDDTRDTWQGSFACPPYRLSEGQPRSDQSGHALPVLPQRFARKDGKEGDVLKEAVEYVERLPGDAPVTYNLRVAPDHNYFADGILVHNCDDPHSVREAESDTVRESTLTWWTESMSTRLSTPKTGAYIIIMQRVHERDLVGHLLAEHSVIPWTVLCLPAEYEPDHPQRWFRDPRKEVGELLWPERFGPREIADLKQRLGEYGVAAQLQQRPSPRAGGFFRRRWFGYLRVAPADCLFVRAWDLAASQKTLMRADPDFTATVLVGWSPSLQRWIIAEAAHDRMEAHEVENWLKNQAEADGLSVVIQLPQDPGQAGKAQSQNFISILSRYTVFATPVTGDKMARALAWAGKAGAGMVLLVEGDWNKFFLDELTSFPNGAHDDLVDACSSAFDRLANSTLGILSYYEAELIKAGRSLADIKTPYERQEEARLAATAGVDPAAAVSDQHIDDLARALGYRAPEGG